MKKQSNSKNQESLFIPEETEDFYHVSASQQKGEQDLVTLSKDAGYEVEWVCYPERNEWIFIPQEHIENEFMMAVGLYTFYAANLYKKGNHLRYQIHPELMAHKFLAQEVLHAAIIGKLSGKPNEKKIDDIISSDLGFTYIIFPSEPDLSGSMELWEHSGKKEKKEFAIASPKGISYIQILSESPDFIKNYNEQFGKNFTQDYLLGELQNKRFAEGINQIVDDFNKIFNDDMHLDFKCM